MTAPTDGSSVDAVPFGYIVTLIRTNLILIFFATLGLSALIWMISFNVFLTRAMIVRAFRSCGVSHPRTRRAFNELKRKSFHLAGLLIPFIYYIGLHHSNGLITRPRGLVMLGSLTAFLWIVEILRYVSPAFRGHYNRLFSAILRKHELVASTLEEATQEGTLAHSVDQIVQSITTPLLGELPNTNASASPRNNQNNHNHHDGAHQRRGGETSSEKTAAAAQFATPQEYNKNLKTGGPGSSPKAAAPIVTERIFTGTGFFFAGCWLAMLLYEPTIATCCMLFLVLGDMSAAIVGISFGNTIFAFKIGKKSLEGTIAMWSVCATIGAIFFFNVPGSLPVVLLAALAATLVELLGPDGKWWADDNLTIPLTTGLAFTTLFYLTNGGIPTPKV